MNNAVDQLRYCRQNENSIGAECLSCGRILEVPQANLIATIEGYSLITPVICQCGKTYCAINGKSFTFKPQPVTMAV